MKIDYNNLYTHFVFTVFERQRNMPEKNRVRIEKYTTGIVNRNKSKLYAIYANPEHVHLLLSRSPKIGKEELATIIADNLESFINENHLSTVTFRWQQSASAFSVSKSHVDKVCKYILNQPEHHKKHSFADEYEKFLKFYEETIRNKVNKVDDVL